MNNPNYNKRIGEAFRHFRYLSGHTQTQIGEMLGTTFQQVQKYERGINRLPSDKLITFCDGINLDIKTFVGTVKNEGIILKTNLKEGNL